ncbi:hypothetical protein [Comamonas thiooxydans]|uniref:hypothetical protein n=1 Tax=Comamonas thiooxydans TaxID=363952 RepID=UPI001551FE21|nr:hypothetical protein [Comamonas thiooxydans]
MMQWLLQLMPQQKAKGNGVLQAGRVEGDLNNSQNSNNQTVYNIVVLGTASATVQSMEQPTQPPIQSSKLASAAALPKADTTQPQRDLLRLMAKSPALESLAEAFMRREFDTDRVKKLTNFECLRTTRYLETCIQREAQRRA